MKKILIYNSGGGLGDSIQLFSLILSLKNHFKNSDFFYLSAHENHFNNKLKEFNINIKSLDLGIKYFGFRLAHYFKIIRYSKNNKITKFDLILDLQSKIRNTIILKKIPHLEFYSPCFNYFFCSKKRNYQSLSHLDNISKLLDQKINFIDFNVNDLSSKYFDEAEKLLPGKNYIGLSITQGNKYRKKTWKLENFIDLSKILIQKNKYPVFFVEKNNIDLIDKIKKKVPDALFPESVSKINSPVLVTTLATRLEKAITVDNGVMHMLGLAKIPLITLFGPTDSNKFSPKYNNVKIIDSKKLYGTKDINKIKVEDILKYIF